MSSHAIIPTIPTIKNENSSKTKKEISQDTETTLRLYLKNKFDLVYNSPYFLTSRFVDPHTIRNIKNIMEFTKNTEKRNLFLSKLNLFYEKICLDNIPDSLKNDYKYSKDKVKERFDKFFSDQYNCKEFNEVLSLYNYQNIVLQFFNEFLFQLIEPKNQFIHNQYYSSHLNLSGYNIDPKIETFSQNYINRQSIILNTAGDNELSIFTEKEKNIYEMLKEILKTIIKKTLKLQNNNSDKKVIIYGSFTVKIINPNAHYNDIDIYHYNPLQFFSTIMLMFHFIMDIDVTILKIPFIIGHLSLKYKTAHFSDVIYIDRKTMEQLPKQILEDMVFLSPLIQVLNHIRMMIDFKRLHQISKNKENQILKLATLLNYINNQRLHIDKTSQIDYDNLIYHDFDVHVIDNRFFVIDLETYLQKFPDYDKVKDQLKYKYLIFTFFQQPQTFLNLFNGRLDMTIYKQWYGVFNEIRIEFDNKDKNDINIQQNYFKKKSKSMIQMNENYYIYKENIQEFDKNDTKNNTSIDQISQYIETSNTIILSNFTNDCYLKLYYNKSGKFKPNKTKVANLSKTNFLASFVLSNVLKHPNNHLLNKFYLEILLGFINQNNVDEEFEFLAQNPNIPQNRSSLNSPILNNPKNKSQKFLLQRRITLQGRHKQFYLEPYYKYTPEFFYKPQEKKTYQSYDEFLELTYYNQKK